MIESALDGVCPCQLPGAGLSKARNRSLAVCFDEVILESHPISLRSGIRGRGTPPERGGHKSRERTCGKSPFHKAARHVLNAFADRGYMLVPNSRTGGARSVCNEASHNQRVAELAGV